MTTINLLPWREERRELRKKQFIAISFAVAALGLLLSGLVWAYYKQQLADQNAANELITTQNQALDQKLKSLDGLQAKRDEILQRMKLIQDLQGVRPVIVHVFDEIARLTPANMYLTGFARQDNKFTITGKALDPNVVSDFLRNLGGSPWFRNAFMNSFIAVEAKPVLPGAVTPRVEDSYGTFLVTVDLANTGTIIDGTTAMVGPSPTTQTATASSPTSTPTPAAASVPTPVAR